MVDGHVLGGLVSGRIGGDHGKDVFILFQGQVRQKAPILVQRVFYPIDRELAAGLRLAGEQEMILLHRDGVHLLVEAQNRRDPVRINGFPVNHIGHVVQGAAHAHLIGKFFQLYGDTVAACQHHLL